MLVVSFGGPEHPDDVMPFLENVLAGKRVPRERMLEVAQHYQQFGGISPLNQQVRDLLAVLKPALRHASVDLPVFWGNRNWHPLLSDTIGEMQEAGVRRGLALVLSAYSSYSGCRQYREDIERARAKVGSDAPEIDKIRVFYNHPDFIAANADNLRSALATHPYPQAEEIDVAFTAHSVPQSMAQTSDYVRQLTETSRLVAEASGVASDRWQLVYQSRSGRPQDPWLEPDICDHVAQLAADGRRNLVIMPIGFLSDHIEVLFDLDQEARDVCRQHGIRMIRAATVGTHPRFVAMLADLVRERLEAREQRPACGAFPASHDVCPIDCCPSPQTGRREPGQSS